MEKIINKSDPLLRQIAAPVEESEFGGKELNRILDNMRETLASFDDGIALAAPQIGISKRIFIISARINEERPEIMKNLIFINPEIKRRSKKLVEMEEGCLSVRNIYGKTKRNEKITVEAKDEAGKKFQYHGSGLLAQIFQHETDHLNGILFIDQAIDLHEITPESQG